MIHFATACIEEALDFGHIIWSCGVCQVLNGHQQPPHPGRDLHRRLGGILKIINPEICHSYIWPCDKVQLASFSEAAGRQMQVQDKRSVVGVQLVVAPHLRIGKGKQPVEYLVFGGSASAKIFKFRSWSNFSIILDKTQAKHIRQALQAMEHTSALSSFPSWLWYLQM